MAGKGPAGGESSVAEAEPAVRPKQRGGRIVPSRYLQYDKKTVEKDTTKAKGLEKLASPKKRLFVQAQKCKKPVEIVRGGLQSTMLEGLEISRPDLEISAINEKSRRKKEQTLLSSDPDDLIGVLDSQTLLLMFASITMEKNLTQLEEKAESNLLTLCEEREKLQQEVHRKKHELLQLEKENDLWEALDKQFEMLSPVAEQCVKFQEEYKNFATALDSTRHELPVKEIYMEENKGQYLADLQNSLAATQKVLSKGHQQHSEENSKALSVMKELEEVSLKLDAELQRTFAQVLDLSASVSKETALHCQKLGEDTLGLEAMKQWYFS
ncbi:HAUS augmin-like complex subunit 8 isoform X2 [Tiliqua scincoides]|uniref:HAUS augmin-like complex subunit 8 isoform X2 n=1 Tax=Tiliqua scincoides TaxID=71010 RepID=UPI00346292AA